MRGTGDGIFDPGHIVHPIGVGRYHLGSHLYPIEKGTIHTTGRYQ
jgi:hypothetical protein